MKLKLRERLKRHPARRIDALLGPSPIAASRHSTEVPFDRSLLIRSLTAASDRLQARIEKLRDQIVGFEANRKKVLLRAALVPRKFEDMCREAVLAEAHARNQCDFLQALQAAVDEELAKSNESEEWARYAWERVEDCLTETGRGERAKVAAVVRRAKPLRAAHTAH